MMMLIDAILLSLKRKIRIITTKRTLAIITIKLIISNDNTRKYIQRHTIIRNIPYNATHQTIHA
jgi:hypothetical protein